MGTTFSSGMGDALFTRTQQRVLGLLFGQPHRSFYTNEIVRLARVGTGTVHRELARLCKPGLITMARTGNQKHYQANPESPVFEELRAIVRKTFGLADVLRESLSQLSTHIHAAFVFGSVAAGTDTAGSDIDLFIVGDDLAYPDVMAAMEGAEAELRRKVSPTLYMASEMQEKLESGNAFVTRLLDRPKIFLVGSMRELG